MALIKKMDGTTWVFFIMLILAIIMVVTALVSKL